MEDTGAVIPLEPNAPNPSPSPASQIAIPRWLAAVQMILVSGIPTQLLLTAVLILGMRMSPWGSADAPGGMTLEFLSLVMLFDTALTALLIRIFLEMSGEDSRSMFLGRRPILGEIWRGLAFIPVVFIGVTLVTLGLRAIAPWLHTVQTSPMLQFMNTPLDAAIFMVVAMLGGGVKEELQRAFVLRRFEQSLGGARLGLLVWSGLFGILHFDQGLDVAIAIGLLGLFWGVLYLKRRSIVMSMVNHAGFNGAQVVQVMLVKALGL